jgi:hypothetical protein
VNALYDFIAESFIGRVFKALDGYKSYMLGIGSFCSGITGLIGHFYPDLGLGPGLPVDACIALFYGGWYAIAKKSAIVKSTNEIVAAVKAEKPC